jgi:ABC-type uncharacterized transport system substrate-binding protein
LLKESTPSVTRAAILRDPALGTGTSQFAVIQAAAPLFRVEVNPVNMRDAREIERAIETFARSPNGGLIVTAGGAAQRHREMIIALAARHKLPAVYWERFFVTAGGFISYGPSLIEQYRQAADYVVRILETFEDPLVQHQRLRYLDTATVASAPESCAFLAIAASRGLAEKEPASAMAIVAVAKIDPTMALDVSQPLKARWSCGDMFLSSR